VSDAATVRVCSTCGPRPSYRFTPRLDQRGRLRYSKRCNSCWAKIIDLTVVEDAEDPFREAPREAPRYLQGLPPLDLHGLCPRCSREWPVNQRCRGYRSTYCDRYEPHYHRICVTCAEEVMERDVTRKPSLPVSRRERAAR
jgi:hypothetical protein